MVQFLAESNLMIYLMVLTGVVGVLTKFILHITLRRLVKASANMAKSTHRLIKLVRAKYEHACMVYDRVENTESFVEKYISEYRAAGLRLHTLRQLERQTIVFCGILGAIGTFARFYYIGGFGESVYQMGAMTLVEMMALFVLCQMTDEKYKLETIKVYMMDYLENVCAHRFQKIKKNEKEKISVISPEAIPAQENKDPLPISIEGEPKLAVHEAGRVHADEQPALKEDAIRQILEEFLA